VNTPDAAAQGSFYDDAPCGLLRTRQDGLIETANRTFCRWVGMTPEALCGHVRFQDLLTAGGRIFHYTHFGPLLLMQGSVSEVKLDLRTADGTVLPIMVNAVRTERDGTVTHALAVFVAKDRHAYERELMSSRRQAEALAEQEQRAQEALRDADRRKDEFLAMLAHELRNPLAPIATSAQLLKLATADPRRVDFLADVISRQIGHLTHLVDDLLDVSRVTRGVIELQRSTVSIASVVAAAIEQARPLMDARGHVFEAQLRASAFVSGDQTRLVQILANLLNNAAKYTPQGGRIDLIVDREGHQVRIDVIDNGIGIDAQLLPRVFELFSQAERTPDRSQGGLGIGLALVRSLVELHGGGVEVHSEGLHAGSRFTIRLPQVEPTTMPPLVRPDPSRAHATGRVLVTDDNLDAALTLADILRFAGHAVDIATTAQEALERVCAGMAAYDACVLDIGLPDMSGYELASRIRALPRHPAPILIAVTGYGQAHDLVLSRAAGFDHHCVKPVEPQLMLKIVNEAVARQPVARGAMAD
jgi:PAS domain S-box-containing protein